MGAIITYKYGTEAQILALTPTSSKWVDRAFYYPDDKSYFFQALNGVMKRYGAGDIEIIGVGVKLNGNVIGGVKSSIKASEILEIPIDYEYNIHKLNVSGVINCDGQINII